MDPVMELEQQVKRVNVIDWMMTRAADFRRGKIFEVRSEFDQNQIEPVVFGGYALLAADDPRIVQAQAVAVLRAELETVADTNPFEDEAARAAKIAELAATIAVAERELKEIRARSRVITFRTSTTGKDRHGTRIKTDGIDVSNYERNPVFLWGHDGYGGWFSIPELENVIGRCVAIRKSISSMEQDFEFTPEDVNPKGDRAYRMVLAKFLQATSIGFIPKQVVVELEDEKEVPVIVKSELLETSLVTIPSNPEVAAFVRDVADAFASRTSSVRIGDIELRGPIAERMLISIPSEKKEIEVAAQIDEQTEKIPVPDEGQDRETPPATAADVGVAPKTAEELRRAIEQWQCRMAIRAGLRVC